MILVPDPYSFPADRALLQIAERSAGVPVLGGISSARTLDGGAALFCGDEVAGDGAVGVVLRGIEVLPCVSQGAAPIGPPLTVTDAHEHVVRELDGRPALDGAARRDRVARPGGPRGRRRRPAARASRSATRPTTVRASERFLVRGIIGADPDAGTLAVGASVEAGQVVRLHVRDAGSADRELRAGLGLRREALGGTAAGALVFTCNGRGRAMFDVSDHDADASTRSSAACRPRASWRPARSAPSAARTSCTASPRRSRCSVPERLAS